MAWRASSDGGGAWLVARREVRSTGGAHGDVGGAVPWLDSAVPRDVLAAMEGGGGELAGGAPAVDSLRGRKYLLGSDAGHPRTAATGLNQQLVGARSRGAWQLGG
jgi:hypothetical protein